MQRLDRLKAIRRIIQDSKISNQEELLSELVKEGFDVTQATLSRDLKHLKVAKVSDGKNGYRYSIPGTKPAQQTGTDSSAYMDDLKRGFLSVSFSGNICMIFTLVGHANSVAAAIDALELPGIIGTIAGDDTILAVIAEDAGRSELEAFFGGLS